ncbi:hypothetical protein MUK42_35007 [Musa troglodytarum]|uniref:Uncharacterized protein n=1 Tax=Musa troglodytarum TaxID=320322 RepID=A0A9E7EI88_9LILI|nr:hypothetical protein MUK42_35007 [Musa troglodytarum]
MEGLLKWTEGPPPDPEAPAFRRLHQLRYPAANISGISNDLFPIRASLNITIHPPYTPRK